MLTSLYQETILDHYRRPRNRGPLPNADAAVELRNPLCGDVVTVMLRFDTDGRVSEARFEAEGCSIAKASASMLTEVVRGLTISEVHALERRVRALLAGELAADAPVPGELVAVGPVPGEPSADAPVPGELAPDATPPLPGDLVALGAVARFPARVRCASMAWDSLAAGIVQSRTAAG